MFEFAKLLVGIVVFLWQLKIFKKYPKSPLKYSFKNSQIKQKT